MHTQTVTGATADPLSPQWIYDTLMEQIEPDLTSANIQRADELYPEETPDEKTARYERYELAFILLNECLEDLAVDAHFDTLELKQAMTAMASESTRREDENALRGVEDQIDSDTDK